MARTTYQKYIDEPRAVIDPRNEMIKSVNEKRIYIKLVGIKKLDINLVFFDIS